MMIVAKKKRDSDVEDNRGMGESDVDNSKRKGGGFDGLIPRQRGRY